MNDLPVVLTHERAQIGRDCGGCLAVVTPSQIVTGARVPKPAAIVDVVAIQRGTTDPERVIVLTGHIDSRVTDVMNATVDAPGADDDGSGVAAVIEAARILSRYKFPATLVYGVLSGEEQGLYGGKVLADHAKTQGWRVEADLNNDIVGATRGQNGVVNNTRLRLFSEGTRDTENAEDYRHQHQDLRTEGGVEYCHGMPRRGFPRRATGLIGATPRRPLGRMPAMPAAATASRSPMWRSMISPSVSPACPRMVSKVRWCFPARPERSGRAIERASFWLAASKPPLGRILEIPTTNEESA